MNLAFDHVIFAVQDLDGSARRFRSEFGLASVAGGRHTGLGTENRIVPLGPDYLELMAVVDESGSGGSYLSEWVAARAKDGDRPSALCLRTDGIASIAARLGEQPIAMQRERPDGQVLHWQLVGLQRTLVDPAFPFFIQWDVPENMLPGRSEAEHSLRPSGIAWVEVEGEANEILAYVGETNIDIRIVEGAGGVVKIGIDTSQGQIELG